MAPKYERPIEAMGLSDFLAGKRDTPAALAWIAHQQKLEAENRHHDIAPPPHEVRNFGLLAGDIGRTAITET